MTRTRSGATLAELLVALVITAVVAALAAGSMVAAERHLRAGSGGSDAARLEQQVELVLRSELRGALGDSLIPRGDTALEVLAHVGSSALCSWSGRVVTVPPPQSSSNVPLSRWRYTPTSGDQLYVYDTAAARWTRFSVDSAVSRLDPAGCPPSSGMVTRADSVARRAAMRLYLGPDAPSGAPVGVMVGAPLRLVRRGRWGLVRGTDKSWELAYRSCDLPGHCGPSQPVAGPLAAPSDTGLRFRVVAPGEVAISIRAAPAAGVVSRGVTTTIRAMTPTLP